MEFEQILKLVDHVSASHLESFCYESDGVKLTLNNKIAPVIIPGTMQNNILSGAETGEKVSYMEKNIAFRNRLQIEKWRIKNFLQVRKNRLQIQ